MFLDHRGTYLEQVRAYLGAAMYPLQVAIDSPAAGLRWMRENLALRERLIAENAPLRRESLTASAELQRLAALQAENARFRALLDSKARVPDRVVVGEILAVDMDPLRHRVILNKGGRDGAYEGQALIDASGVVGQITRDQRDSSEAILITDPDHAVPVEIVRNGLRTIAVGTGDLERLSLPFLTRNADIKAGDLLVTSGLGGAFPAGYPVGTRDQVDGSSGDAFLEVAAKPAANLDRLHEVLLVFLQRSAAARRRQRRPRCRRPPYRPRNRRRRRRRRRRRNPDCNIVGAGTRTSAGSDRSPGHCAGASGGAGARRGHCRFYPAEGGTTCDAAGCSAGSRNRNQSTGRRAGVSAPRWPVWLLMLLALVAELLPLPAAMQPLRPAWTTMVVIYWSLMWPGRFGVFSAFLVGLLVDVAHGSLAGPARPVAVPGGLPGSPAAPADAGVPPVAAHPVRLRADVPRGLRPALD